MPKRVYLGTTDLVFRSKLGAVVQVAGALVTRDEAASDLALIELGGRDATARIRAFVARGVPVLAFASHVRAHELRSAREAGAVAVPNSEVADRLRGML